MTPPAIALARMNMKSAISCRQKSAACWLIDVDTIYCYHYYQLFTFPPTKGMATRNTFKIGTGLKKIGPMEGQSKMKQAMGKTSVCGMCLECS